ncbi:F0F1 ATP synthase subunit I [Endozoicomonas montiporae CL-33]|uniref:F0F1 ATP synthase subunit I n=2 Tax=Endozoicomonas montiporae TaxID=1027273 RepID=A0A142BJ96_9GAMM|nr:F0F1 ATP synthase subunit I [Endozoicomonas montiporae CL-33]
MSEVRAWKYSNKDRYPHLHRPAVYRVVLAQLLTTLCLSLFLLPLGTIHVISAFMGGLACTVPNAYLVWKAFRYRGASAAQKIARSFYQGEAGKFALTMLAFVLIFTLVKPVEPLSLFGAFVLVQSINWFTPLLVGRRQ